MDETLPLLSILGNSVGSLTTTANLPLLLEDALKIVSGGLTANPNNDVASLIAQEYSPRLNGQTAGHPDPPYAVYPRHGESDAPYSQSESVLRSAIYIPETFKWGARQPVILSPGTGSFGAEDFISNLIPLLNSSSFRDPIWLNPPSRALGNAQLTAEMVAYAINYIAAVTGRDVAVITESQGSVDTQWALKYWPSTRSDVSDFIPISGDFKGTLLFDGPVANLIGAPSFFQQRYTGSNFIPTLRSNGGSSAYVPTTAIWTATDEVVQPQIWNSASAFINDERNIGVSNNQIQDVCPLLPAGGVYGHVDILFNSLTWAVIEDALTHDGLGQPSRLNLGIVCNGLLAPGLTSNNFLAILALVPEFLVDIILYEPKVDAEPAIKSYALSK
jgi:hypothetical protein